MLWPEGDSLRVTARVEKLVKSLLRCFARGRGAVSNVKRLSSLVGMAAQCLAMGDVDFENNSKKMEIVNCFNDKIKGKGNFVGIAFNILLFNFRAESLSR